MSNIKHYIVVHNIIYCNVNYKMFKSIPNTLDNGILAPFYKCLQQYI